MLTLVNGDAVRIPLPDQSIHTVVTSPPYWGLRAYEGIEPTVWPGVTYCPMPGVEPITIPGDKDCDHVWGEERVQYQRGSASDQSTLDGGPQSGGEGRVQEVSQGQWCQRCGAWRGMLGLEPSVEMFIGHLVLVFREVRRVLRDDGTAWINLGDSYSGSGKGSGGRGAWHGTKQRTNAGSIGLPVQDWNQTGLKPKDLCGIPWRAALALQADGWWLRSDIIWTKGLAFCEDYAGSCMPESVRDRCTRAHEHVFMLTKKPRYFWDREAVKEDAVGRDPGNTYHKGAEAWLEGDKFQRTKVGLAEMGPVAKRNLRDVWAIANHDAEFAKFCGAQGVDIGALLTAYRDGQRDLKDAWAVNPASYPGSHYAVFPAELVEPCIKAGTSEHGVCPICKAPWERVTKKTAKVDPSAKESWFDHGKSSEYQMGRAQRGKRYLDRTVGWRPTCDCTVSVDSGALDPNTGEGIDVARTPEPVPATVLDPFAGSGTTGEVARRLGRDCVLLDLSHDYLAEQAAVRLEIDKLKAWHGGNGNGNGHRNRNGNGRKHESTILEGLPLFAMTEKEMA